jgi:hypothetical protein
MNIPLTLTHMRPSEEWTLDGDTYEGLTWLSDTPKPTEAEIAEAEPVAVAEAQAKVEAGQAARLAAISHAKSLGFTDEMIAVMYPNLGSEA